VLRRLVGEEFERDRPERGLENCAVLAELRRGSRGERLRLRRRRLANRNRVDRDTLVRRAVPVGRQLRDLLDDVHAVGNAPKIVYLPSSAGWSVTQTKN
jgi:hypothetical protein